MVFIYNLGINKLFYNFFFLFWSIVCVIIFIIYRGWLDLCYKVLNKELFVVSFGFKMSLLL